MFPERCRAFADGRPTIRGSILRPVKDSLPKNVRTGGWPWLGMALVLSLLTAPACIRQRCYSDSDCPASQTCDRASGVCHDPCDETGACDPGSPDDPGGLDAGGDEARPVEAGGGLSDAARACPEDMVQVGTICMDRWEASRSDATARQAGADQSIALSRPGVLPWYVNPMTASAFGQFKAACQAVGKRLCTSAEWLDTCRGPDRSTYFFGNVWNPATCNSVDTYCQKCCDILGLSPCPTGENCGYASTLSSSYTPETCSISADYGRDTCHVCYHVMPTGAFPQCTSRGVFDVNGNVWEVVTSSDDGRGYQVRGGAFNCGSPSARFACSFNATWSDLYAGFRCCKDLSPR